MKGLAAMVLVVATVSGCAAHAQSSASGNSPVFEIGAEFSTLHANAGPAQCGCFFMYGGSVQAAMVSYRGMALLADFGRTSIANANGSGNNITLTTYMGGLRYPYRFHQGWTLYAHGLWGVGHTSSNNPIDAGVSRIAAAGGGGLVVKLSPHWQAKLAEAQYEYTSIPNAANNIQNQFRLSSGLVFRFARH